MDNIRLINANALKEAFKEAYAGITFSLLECNDLINDAPTVNPSKALEEIIKYMKDDTVTYRDITDDIIIQILKDNGLWEDN